jgi:SulP family sulfate permease
MAQPPQPSPLEQLAALADEGEVTGQATALSEEAISPWLSFLAGGITGVVSLVKAISYGALIFSGELSPFLSVGLGLLFISNILIRLVTALTSSFRPIIYNPQSEQVVIVSFMAASIAKQIAPNTSPEVLLITVVLGIGFSTLLTGCVLIVLGFMRQGNLGRYLPYPIIGGFLAGVSWLMMSGGFKIIAGEALNSGNAIALSEPGLLIQMLVGLGFAGILFGMTRHWKQAWIMPMGFLGATGIFYIMAAGLGFSAQDLRAQGWLLDLPRQGSLWQPLPLTAFRDIDWALIQGQTGTIFSLSLMSTLGLLLGATNLEVALDKEIALNRELKSLGTANLIAGLFGGLAGSLSLNSSLLAYKLGGRTRWVGLSGAVIFALALAWGSTVIAYLPTFAFGGLLLFLGFDLLTEWMYAAWFKLPKDEYLIALLVFGEIVFSDLITGIGIGLLLAVILFVVNYSRISPTRYDLFGDSYKSNVIRPTHQERFLREMGSRIYMLQLEGYLFFGSANTLVNKISSVISQSVFPIRFILLDFRLVRGVDFSATLSFRKLKVLAQKHDIIILLTQILPKHLEFFRKASVVEYDDKTIRIFESLDRGFEWCEEKLLEEGKWRRQRFFPLAMQFGDIFQNQNDTSEFIGYLESLDCSGGDIIAHAGELEQGLYFVEFGQISAVITLENQAAKRLRTYTAGTVCGEKGLVSSLIRSSTLIAEQNSKLYLLSREKFTQMEQQAPHLANALLKLVLHAQNEQIESYEKEIRFLLQ